jgi:hypothetical protein
MNPFSVSQEDVYVDAHELQFSERHRTIVDRFAAACRVDARGGQDG